MRIGRSITTAIAVHAALKQAVHSVGEAFLAKTSQSDQSISDAEIPDAIARDAEVYSRAEVVAIAALSKDYPKKLKPDVVRWVVPGWYSNAYYSVAVTPGRIYYTPIFVVETTTYIRIAIDVDTEVAGSADLRIFAWENGLPGALILSAGTVDTTEDGKKEITIAQELTRGYYFLAIRCSANPTLDAMKGGSD
ncbi:unnamed protein product, partial [marine sediment metagenome]